MNAQTDPGALLRVLVDCPKCQGRRYFGSGLDLSPCRNCHGTGKVPKYPALMRECVCTRYPSEQVPECECGGWEAGVGGTGWALDVTLEGILDTASVVVESNHVEFWGHTDYISYWVCRLLRLSKDGERVLGSFDGKGDTRLEAATHALTQTIVAKEAE